MGTTNVAKVQDWNVAIVSFNKQRVVSCLNGHKLRDAIESKLPPAVTPALTLLGGKDADIYFKDFEILEPAQ